MKNTLKWILIALALVGIIVGATVLYNKLSDDYKGDNLAQNSQTEDKNNTSTESDFTAPDFTVLDYNGNKVKLSDYKGKPIVLNFWATWCYYCTQEMPDFNKAYKAYPDVQFLMINATDGTRETVEIAKDYVKEQSYDFDIFFDTNYEAINAYYVSSFPTTFFIDSDGNLITYANGMLDYQSLEKGIKMIIQ